MLENQIEPTQEKKDKCLSDSTLQEKDQEINTNKGEQENDNKQ